MTMGWKGLSAAAIVAIGVGAGAPVDAQQWVNPDTGRSYDASAGCACEAASGDAQDMAEELRALVAEAERDAIADPEFLRDLRALAASYVAAGPTLREPAVLIREIFDDGELATDPHWRPYRGAWLIDPEFGLRAAEAGGGAAIELAGIGSQEAIDAAFDRGGPPVVAAHLIGFEKSAPNAASVFAEVTDHQGEGASYLILHQGPPSMSGYRLELRGGVEPSVALWRHGRRGASRLGVAAAPELRQGRMTSVSFRRTSDTRMTVRLDGRDALTVRDDGFQHGWSGFAFLNLGGDFSLREVTIAESE